MDSLWKELCDQCVEIKDTSDQQTTKERDLVLDFTKQINGNLSVANVPTPTVDICIAYSAVNGRELAT